MLEAAKELGADELMRKAIDRAKSEEANGSRNGAANGSVPTGA